MRGRVIWFVSGVLALLVSCAHLKTTEHEIASKKAELRSAGQASMKYYSSGDFQRALEAYREVYNKYPGDAEVLKEISGVIASIYRQADVAYEEADFASAGRLCRVLLSSAAQFKGPRGTLMFDSGTVSGRLADCSGSLIRKGLHHYRAGDLKRAVSIWEQVLEFDPENRVARKAVSTASGQMKTLR